jgi:RNA polymerase sigma-70 factor (ECF subfamily)
MTPPAQPHSPSAALPGIAQRSTSGRVGTNGREIPGESDRAPQGASLAYADSESTTNTEAAGNQGDDAWDLVRAAQGGDTEAFGQLYDRYVDVVYRYVLIRVGDRPLAEDVTSETFLRALRRIAAVTYQGRDVGAWFVTIARNLVLDHVKSSRYRLEVPTAEMADSHGVQNGPEQKVLDEATHVELLRCLEKLNSDQRECLVLRFLQGLSVSKTAELMGRNEGAVKALQHRAVRRLAQLLPRELR